jgi:hypothetical protein
MSLSTYSDLRTALTARLDVSTSDISNSNADDLFTEAEKRIYRELRIRDMETSFSSTISGGVIALPSGYVELKYAYVEGTPICPLQRKTPQWIYLNYPTRSSQGRPKFIAREGSNFIFGPYPDSGYTINGVYYTKPSTVVNTTLTGVLLTNPDLLLYATLVEAEKFLGREQRGQVWETRYTEVKNQIIRENEWENGSGSPLTITVA